MNKRILTSQKILFRSITAVKLIILFTRKADIYQFFNQIKDKFCYKKL
jgi:hypothetical protein